MADISHDCIIMASVVALLPGGSGRFCSWCWYSGREGRCVRDSVVKMVGERSMIADLGLDEYGLDSAPNSMHGVDTRWRITWRDAYADSDT